MFYSNRDLLKGAMKNKILLFEYPGCPYCFQTRRIMREFISEHSELRVLEFSEINEVDEEDFVSKFEYDETPAMFYKDSKIYECNPKWNANQVKENLKIALEQVLKLELAAISEGN